MTPPDPGFPVTLDSLLKVWQLIGSPLVAAVFLYVRSINTTLKKLNGELIDVKRWRIEHEKKDDERFTGITRQLTEVREDLRDRPVRAVGSGP